MHTSQNAHLPARVFLALFCLLVAAHPAFSQASRIGDAVRILNRVTGKLGPNTVDVSRGDTVFRDQRISTKQEASAQFQFLDDTYLAMSENASVALDKFVYAGNAKTGEVTINVAKGAFRFITGKQKSESYRINLPTGVIGVRGTMFDLFVGLGGAALVVLYDGAVEFCGVDGRCLDLTNRCEAAAIGADGRLASSRRLSRALLQGTRLQDAVPFLADQTGLIQRAALPGTVVTDCLSAVAALLPAPRPRNKAKAAPKRLKPKAVHKRSRSNARRKCPPGTRKAGKRCRRIVRKCPRGTVRKGKRCLRVARKCPRGTVRKGKRCLRVVRACPRGKVRRGNRCVRVKVRRCPSGLIPAGAACVRIQIPVFRPGPSRPNRRRIID